MTSICKEQIISIAATELVALSWDREGPTARTHYAAMARAESEGRTLTNVVREALQRYIDSE